MRCMYDVVGVYAVNLVVEGRAPQAVLPTSMDTHTRVVSILKSGKESSLPLLIVQSVHSTH